MLTSLEDFFMLSPLEKGWRSHLEIFLNCKEMKKLFDFVDQAYGDSPLSIYPPRSLIFNALNLTSFNDVKVVIIGQDPYHGAQQAEGLAFSVPPGVALPPSLKNIFKELYFDTNINLLKSNGSLHSLAKQGILLLNSTLTVKEGEPLSHHGVGWESFTDEIVLQLSQREDPVIFVLWGKSAQQKCHFLSETVPSSFILTAAHPSPFSAHRGFFGCRHFSKINQLLIELGKKPIDWNLL
jgi:uracil-DNA glycosylase